MTAPLTPREAAAQAVAECKTSPGRHIDNARIRADAAIDAYIAALANQHADQVEARRRMRSVGISA